MIAPGTVRPLTVLLAAALLVAACGSSSGTVADPPLSTADGSTTMPAPTTTSTAPCGSGGDLSTGGLQERTLTTASGLARTWLLRLPSGYQEGTPAHVVFNFHGHGSNGAQQFVYGNFTDQAERDGVILVMPNALDQGGGALGWEPEVPGSGGDLDFIDELVDLVRAEYCAGSFYAAGMSSGGLMTSALACWPESPFDGYGPVTFAFYTQESCGSAPPRPIAYFHGTDDDAAPFDGAAFVDGVQGAVDPAPVTAQEWADHNGCDPDPVEERISEEVVHFSWERCDAPTNFYVVEGGGHTWPGAVFVDFLGYVTDDISASDLIWDLFFGDRS